MCQFHLLAKNFNALMFSKLENSDLKTALRYRWRKQQMLAQFD